MSKMVEKVFVKDKDIVVPGEVLAKGMDFLPGGKAFRDKEHLCSSVLGLVSIKGRVIKVIPLSGAYIPKKNDVVIGKVKDISFGGWQVDIYSPYSADLGIGEATRDYIDLRKVDLTKYLDINDYIFAKIINVSESKYVKLTIKDRPYKKLREGTIIEVAPTKIPRVIGKQGSMVTMLKEATGCEILIGQNGLIWIQGDPEKEELVVKAIKKIEDEAHKEGLTDRIKEMLDKENGKKRTTRKTNN